MKWSVAEMRVCRSAVSDPPLCPRVKVGRLIWAKAKISKSTGQRPFSQHELENDPFKVEKETMGRVHSGLEAGGQWEVPLGGHLFLPSRSTWWLISGAFF